MKDEITKYEKAIRRVYGMFNSHVEVLFIHERWAVRILNGNKGIAHFHPDNRVMRTVRYGECTLNNCDEIAPPEIRAFCAMAGVPLSST